MDTATVIGGVLGGGVLGPLAWALVKWALARMQKEESEIKRAWARVVSLEGQLREERLAREAQGRELTQLITRADAAERESRACQRRSEKLGERIAVLEADIVRAAEAQLRRLNPSGGAPLHAVDDDDGSAEG